MWHVYMWYMVCDVHVTVCMCGMCACTVCVMHVVGGMCSMYVQYVSVVCVICLRVGVHSMYVDACCVACLCVWCVYICICVQCVYVCIWGGAYVCMHGVCSVCVCCMCSVWVWVCVHNDWGRHAGISLGQAAVLTGLRAGVLSGMTWPSGGWAPRCTESPSRENEECLLHPQQLTEGLTRGRADPKFSGHFSFPTVEVHQAGDRKQSPWGTRAAAQVATPLKSGQNVNSVTAQAPWASTKALQKEASPQAGPKPPA